MIPKPNQTKQTKRTLQANIIDEHSDSKTPQKIQANIVQQTSKRSDTMIKLHLYQECKDSSIYANQSMWYSILTNQKIKNHVIISVDGEKAFDKIYHSFITKTLQKMGIEGIYLNIVNAIYDKWLF